jgi:hypothetical protein
MPTYRVTDSETGRTLRLTGDSPPTDDELEQIFTQYDLEFNLDIRKHQAEQQQAAQQQQAQQEADFRSDPRNWTSDQVKEFAKVNPPQNQEEKGMMDALMKQAQQREKAVTDEIAPDEKEDPLSKVLKEAQEKGFDHLQTALNMIEIGRGIPGPSDVLRLFRGKLETKLPAQIGAIKTSELPDALKQTYAEFGGDVEGFAKAAETVWLGPILAEGFAAGALEKVQQAKDDEALDGAIEGMTLAAARYIDPSVEAPTYGRLYSNMFESTTGKRYPLLSAVLGIGTFVGLGPAKSLISYKLTQNQYSKLVKETAEAFGWTEAKAANSLAKHLKTVTEKGERFYKTDAISMWKRRRNLRRFMRPKADQDRVRPEQIPEKPISTVTQPGPEAPPPPEVTTPVVKAAAAAKRPAKRKPGPSKGAIFRLTGWIRSMGGITPGSLRGVGISPKDFKEQTKTKNLISPKGFGFDQIAQAALEHGYIQESDIPEGMKVTDYLYERLKTKEGRLIDIKQTARQLEAGYKEKSLAFEKEQEGLSDAERIPDARRAEIERVAEGEAQSEVTQEFGDALEPEGPISEEAVEFAPTTELIRARVRKLGADLQSVEKQMGILEKQKAQLKEAGKSTAAVDRALDKLSKRHTFLDSSIGEIMTGAPASLRAELLTSEGTLKLEALEVAGRRGARIGRKAAQVEERAIAKERRKELKKGFKERVQTVQELKNEAVTQIKEEVPKHKQREFLDAVKNVKTEGGMKRLGKRITALRERVRRRDAVNELKDSFAKVNLKKMRPEYRDKVAAVIDAVDPVRLTEGKIKDLGRLADYLAREPDNKVPASRLAELNRLAKVPVAEMTVDEIETITASVHHMVGLNNLKNRLIIRGKVRQHEDVLEESLDNIRTKHENRNGSLSGLDSFQMEQEAKIGTKIFGVDSFNAELKAEILDGMDKGIVFQTVYEGLDKGTDVQMRHEHEAQDFFREKLEGIDISKWSHAFQKKVENVERVTVDLGEGREISMTPGERIAFYLHSLNDRNVRHITEGGFSFTTTLGKIKDLTDEELGRIVESITDDEKKVATAIHKWFNTRQKEAINEVSVDLLGYELATEPDYFPIRTHFLDRFHDDLIRTKNFTHSALEGLGIFIERQDASNALVVEDAFLALYKSVKKVAAYVGLAKPLRSAKALLNDNEFAKEMRAQGLNHYLQSLKHYVDRIEGDVVRLDNVDRLTQHLINNLDIAILGFNPFVMFKQPISFLAASTEMDWKYLKAGSAKTVTKSDIEEMKKWHPQLRDRFEGNVTRELGEVASVGRPRRFWTGKEVISQVFMGGIRNFDTKAIGRIWNSSKLEIRAKRPELRGDEFWEAVSERAWEVIRRTQPTFHPKDRSTIGMNRMFLIRLATKYSSQRNKNYMMVRRAFERWNRSDKKPNDAAQLGNALFVIGMISPLLLVAIDESRDKLYDRNQQRSLFMRAVQALKVGIGSVYFIGPTIESMVSKIERGTYAGYDISLTALDAWNELVNTFAEAGNAIKFAISGERYISGKKKRQLKWEHSLKRMMINALEVTGKLKGIPVHTIRRMLEAGVRIGKEMT